MALTISNENLLCLLRNDAPKRIKDYEDLKKEKMEGFMLIRNKMTEQLNGIEKKFELLFNNIEQKDILISLYKEVTYANQITETRLNEIYAKLQELIEYRFDEKQGSYHFKKNYNKENQSKTINRMMTTLQYANQLIESLNQLDNDQNEISEQSQIQQVILETQGKLRQNDQSIQSIGSDLSNLDISKINFQLTQNLEGHQTAIQAVAISHDEKYIASGSNTNYEIILWNFETKTMLKKYKGPQYIISLSFSKNNFKLAAAGAYYFNPSDIFIYDIVDLIKNDPIQVLEGHQQGYIIYRIVFTNNSQHLISCSSDRTVRVWDVDGSKEIAKIQCANIIFGFSLSDNEELLGYCCKGGQAYLLECKSLNSLTEKINWQAHTSESYCIGFIKNSTIILTSSQSEIRLWRVDYLLTNKNEFIKEIRSIEGNNLIWTVKVFPFGDPKIIISSQGGKIKIWQMESAQMIYAFEIPGGMDQVGSQFAITSDFKTMVTAAQDKNLKIYQIDQI